MPLVSYTKIAKIASWRKKQLWRIGKGQQEWAPVIQTITDLIQYTLIGGGGLIGLKMFSPQIVEVLEREWPAMINSLIWVSNLPLKRMVLLFIGIALLKNIGWWGTGLWFEISGFFRAEAKTEGEKYDHYLREEVVEPIRRIETKLGIKKDDK